MLGGSRAVGTADAASDWDLGVWYRRSLDLSALAEHGEVHPPGSWGRIMNGGGWFDIDGRRVDVLLRDLDVVERWADAARRGEYEVDGLLGYLAGIPTYTPLAEAAGSIPLVGQLDVDASYPAALSAAGTRRWRFHRDFSLTHARRHAGLGDVVATVGHASRAVLEHAHALACERRQWAVNEKRLLARVGLDVADLLPVGPVADLVRQVDELAAHLGD